MKCPNCGGSRVIKEHSLNAKETVGVKVCETCLTTEEIPQPTREEAKKERAQFETAMGRIWQK